MPDLVVSDVSVSFGGVAAVRGVSLTVPQGAAVGIIGPNGSGKSTLLNAISGLVPCVGAATFGDRRLPFGKPLGIRRSGILRTFQTPQVCDPLSCLENVLVADEDRANTSIIAALLKRPWMIRSERARWARAAAALDRVGLQDAYQLKAELLTYGQRRSLELARAIAARPSLIMLDEPTAGLNAAETSNFAALLRGLLADGISLLVVDHKVDFIDSICQSLVVLEQGSVVATGAPAEVWQNQRVVDAYLGVAYVPGARDDG